MYLINQWLNLLTFNHMKSQNFISCHNVDWFFYRHKMAATEEHFIMDSTHLAYSASD